MHVWCNILHPVDEYYTEQLLFKSLRGDLRFPGGKP